MKKCIPSWSSKWSNHCELKYVLTYKEIRQYLCLGEENEEDCIEVDIVYKNVNHSTQETIVVIDNESVDNLNLNITTNKPYSTESNVVRPPRDEEVIRAS